MLNAAYLSLHTEKVLIGLNDAIDLHGKMNFNLTGLVVLQTALLYRYTFTTRRMTFDKVFVSPCIFYTQNYVISECEVAKCVELAEGGSVTNEGILSSLYIFISFCLVMSALNV